MRQPLWVILCTMGLTAGVVAAAPHSLVDRSLSRTAVDLLGWNETSVSYLDEFGRIRREPIENFVAVLPSWDSTHRAWERPADEALAGGTPVVVELIDGQRMLGSVGPWDSASVPAAGIDEESVTVLTTGFGQREFSLETVGRLLIDPWSRGVARHKPWTPGVDDELILANGDSLHGFLVKFGEEIIFDSGDGERPFPLGRVSEVRLGNPAQTWQGPRVWLSSGAIHAANARGEHEDGDVRLTDDAGHESAQFLIDDIEAAWFDDGSLIPLGSIDISASKSLGNRRWTRNARAGSAGTSPLGTPHIAIPGPMRLEWRLPLEASRFGAIARLGGTLDHPDTPPGRWAHVVLRVSIIVAGEELELTMFELDRGSPTAPIAVSLPGEGDAGRTLVIELQPGGFGPIQDRVLLSYPMLIGF